MKSVIAADTVTKFYNQEYTVYRFGATIDFKTNSKIEGTEQYFLLRTKDQTGYHLFPNSVIKVKMESIGVFLRENCHEGMSIPIPDSTDWTLQATVKQDNEIKKVYYYNKPKSLRSADSAIFSYSASLNNVQFGFSESSGQLHGFKLYMLQVKYNSYFSDSLKITLPQREDLFRFQIHKITAPDHCIIEKILSKISPEQ